MKYSFEVLQNGVWVQSSLSFDTIPQAAEAAVEYLRVSGDNNFLMAVSTCIYKPTPVLRTPQEAALHMHPDLIDGERN